MRRLALIAGCFALVSACSSAPKSPQSPLEPVDPLVLYPAPRYFVDAPLGLRDAHPALRFDSALPPDLSASARLAWDAGGVDRYVVDARYEGGQGIVRAFAESDRAISYARAAAASLVDSGGRLHFATIVDGSPFSLRGYVEGHYGPPLEPWQRRCVIERMNALHENLYLYGPKRDPYAHQQWADHYPPDGAAAMADAVSAAATAGIDFAWAVSPGLEQGYPAPGTSICYSSDADFARLTAKIDAMRALGVTRFGLFLDDINPALVYDADVAAFATPAAAHVALANRLDDYVTATGAPHILFVGPYYMTKLDGWQAWATEVGATLHPGIDVMWTGSAIAPETLSADDLYAPDGLLGRHVVIWNNKPRAAEPLHGFSPGLPAAASGFLSNTIMFQYDNTFADFWSILGTLGDYAWNPAAYDPDRSLSTWTDILSTETRCGSLGRRRPSHLSSRFKGGRRRDRQGYRDRSRWTQTSARRVQRGRPIRRRDPRPRSVPRSLEDRRRDRRV